jgi:hypothetical protein
MYSFACTIKIKMKSLFYTSNYKILYLAILIVCRINLNHSDYMDCNITTIAGGEKVFWWGASIVVNRNALKPNRN